MSPLVSVEEIKEAAARLDGVAVHPPLVPFPRSSPVPLAKAESLQPVGSFKLRGAYAAISALPPEGRRRAVVVTHSSGDHGHAAVYPHADVRDRGRHGDR
jgi:threonine dehydratase